MQVPWSRLMTLATSKNKVNTYLDDDVKEDAQRLASARSRSLSNLIEALLIREIKKAKAEGEF